MRHQGGTVIDDDVRYIEHSLLSDSLGKDGGLGDVEVGVEGKFSILSENMHIGTLEEMIIQTCLFFLSS